jgi:predicted RNase H-like HicB family nuclease
VEQESVELRDGGYRISGTRRVPSVVSQGESLEDLEASIRDAYQSMSEAAPIPAVSC